MPCGKIIFTCEFLDCIYFQEKTSYDKNYILFQIHGAMCD